MLDPLTALNLATSTVQFVQFAGQVVELALKIYDSKDGGIEEHEEIGGIAAQLKSFSDDELKKFSEELGKTVDVRTIEWSRNERPLQSLACDCSRLADDLLHLLKELRRQTSQYKTWDALRRAIRSLRKQGDVKALQARLAEIRGQICFHLLHALRDQQSSMTSSLQDLSRLITSSQLDTQQQVKDTREELLTAIQELSLYVKSSLDPEGVGVDDFMAKFVTASQKANTVSRMQIIINSLRFEEIEMRQEQISEAYERTNRWILEDKKGPFRKWLEYLDGIFWISGKAGSGKSTLMKFVANNPLTYECLRRWAGFGGDVATNQAPQLFVSSHYFWGSGFPMQKSLQGLFQHMLYKILNRCPELVRTACPERMMQSDESFQISESWTVKTLSNALNALLTMEKWPAHFCFFIDGLDEYAGSPEEQRIMVKEITRLASFPHVKICVSSRPWNVFRSAFEVHLDRTLALQEHNKSDLDLYIAKELEADERFVELAAEDADASTFAHEIRDRADGVFLWVFLVVRSLLDGLTEDDDIQMLLTRLRALPPTLEKWFEAMLKSIDPVYKAYTARALLIACASEEPLAAMSYYYLSSEMNDADYALRMEVEPIDLSKTRKRLKSVAAWINKWCRDLLEIPRAPAIIDSGYAWEQDSHVQFLHRTARDFLVTPEIELDLQRNAGRGFSPQLSLCRSYLARAKSIVFEADKAARDHFLSLAGSLMGHARMYEVQRQRTPYKLLEELNRIGNAHANPSGGWHWTSRGQDPQQDGFNSHTSDFFDDVGNFLIYAQRFELCLFLEEVSKRRDRQFGSVDSLSPAQDLTRRSKQSHPGLDIDRSTLREQSSQSHPPPASRSNDSWGGLEKVVRGEQFPNDPTGADVDNEAMRHACPVVGCSKVCRTRDDLQYHRRHRHKTHNVFEDPVAPFSNMHLTTTSIAHTRALNISVPRCKICGGRCTTQGGCTDVPPNNPGALQDNSMGGFTTPRGRLTGMRRRARDCALEPSSDSSEDLALDL